MVDMIESLRTYQSDQKAIQTIDETLDKGMAVFEDAVAKLSKSGGKTVGGDVLFKLYDTYGFPVDLTRVMADERGLTLERTTPGMAGDGHCNFCYHVKPAA